MARTTVPSRPSPKYRRQKRKGKKSDFAFVELAGVRHYLGEYGSRASREKYHQLLAEWQTAGGQAPVPADDITIVELCARYIRHAETYYVKAGKPTSELTNIKHACRRLLDLYGRTPAAQYGPIKLRATRQTMIDAGNARTYCNSQTDRIRRMFRWAVSQEILLPSVYEALRTVDGLRRGRTEARETEPVKPVPAEHIEAVRPLVSRQVWALIDLQLLTGARPGELVGLRPMDLDRSADVWVVHLEGHKTEHYGRTRQILIGPRGQAIIRPFLNRAPHLPLFSPAEAESERLDQRQVQRTTPLHHGNAPGTNRKAKPQREPGNQYNGSSYRRAITRACKQADVPAWRPNQLRHNTATNLRREHGIDTAQTILGHALGSGITEIYAEANVAKATRVIAERG